MRSAADHSLPGGHNGTKEFDVAIVGGGSVGCALAWEAVSRGVRTILLEKDDFGVGTSANSLGIIHGGLRYLQNLSILRARASSRERAILLRIAPHLVTPLECVVPTIRSLMRGRLAFAAGLLANTAVTAGLNKRIAPRNRLSSGSLIGRETLQGKVPGLEMQGVTGAARWQDACMISGERLALAFAQAAHEHGATVLNHFEVLRSADSNGRIRGVVARDTIDGRSHEFAAKVVFDCRGAWAQKQPVLLSADGPQLEFVKAANIVVADCGLKCAVGAYPRDEHGQPLPSALVFARPESGKTIIGTWYFDSRDGQTELDPAELDTILAATNSTFPAWRLERGDVIGVQVGFLPKDRRVDAQLSPVERPIVIDAISEGGLAGLWHVQTEKWTMVRALAEHLITTAANRGEIAASPSRTHEIPLCGGDVQTPSERHATLLARLGEPRLRRLEERYGSRALDLLDAIDDDPSLGEATAFDPEVTTAELAYVANNELVRTGADLYRRLYAPSFGAPTTEIMESLVEYIDSLHRSVVARQA